jgi:hypothetical protein
MGPSVEGCPSSARDEEARGVIVCPFVVLGVEVCPREEFHRNTFGDASIGGFADVLDPR